MQKMHKLIINFNILWLISVGGAKCFVHSIFVDVEKSILLLIFFYKKGMSKCVAIFEYL